MIFGNVNHSKTYSNLEKDLLTCLDYIKNNSLVNYKKGCYEIDGKDIFVNILEYKTCEKEDRFWEAHRKYIDIHIMLDGCERINFNFIENLEQKEYQEDSDFLPLNGNECGYVELNKDDFLICYPQDAHMTAIKVNSAQNIKKAIFKVKIK